MFASAGPVMRSGQILEHVAGHRLRDREPVGSAAAVDRPMPAPGIGDSHVLGRVGQHRLCDGPSSPQSELGPQRAQLVDAGELSYDSETPARVEVAANPATGWETLARLFGDPDPAVAAAARRTLSEMLEQRPAAEDDAAAHPSSDGP